MLTQFQFCEEKGIPFCAVIGESELNDGVVTVRDMQSRQEVETIYKSKLILIFFAEDPLCFNN